MTNTEESPNRPGTQTSSAIVPIIALAVACWVYFLTGAGTGMNVWSMSTLQFPPPVNLSSMAAPPAPGSALPMIGMWWSMMLAMMIPGTLRHFPKTDIRAAVHTPVPVWFGLGYASLWLIYSVAATFLQFILVESQLVHGMTMWSIDNRFSATLLALAGIYQFTGFKARSLSNCREMAEHSSSPQSGFRYGINCLAASFALMLLLFVGGVMNIYWVILLTTIIAIEKTLSDPTPFSRAVGLACLAAATAALAL